MEPPIRFGFEGIDDWLHRGVREELALVSGNRHAPGKQQSEGQGPNGNPHGEPAFRGTAVRLTSTGSGRANRGNDSFKQRP